MYTTILVPVDLAHGDIAERILKLARRIGGSEARITLLTVMDAIPRYAEAQIPQEIIDHHHAEVRDRLRALADAVEPDADIVVRQGQAGHEILGEARRMGADAIVLGSHRPDLRDYLIGSTAARVVRHAQCAVLIDRIRL